MEGKSEWPGRKWETDEPSLYTEKQQAEKYPKVYFTVKFREAVQEGKENKEYEKYLKDLQACILSEESKNEKGGEEPPLLCLADWYRLVINKTEAKAKAEAKAAVESRIKYYQENPPAQIKSEAEKDETLAMLAIILKKFESHLSPQLDKSSLTEKDFHLLRAYAYVFNSLINVKTIQELLLTKHEEYIKNLLKELLGVITAQRLSRGRVSFFFASDRTAQYMEDTAQEIINILITLENSMGKKEKEEEEEKKQLEIKQLTNLLTQIKQKPLPLHFDFLVLIGTLTALSFIFIGIVHPLFFIGAVGFIFPLVSYIKRRQLDKERLEGFKEILELDLGYTEKTANNILSLLGQGITMSRSLNMDMSEKSQVSVLTPNKYRITFDGLKLYNVEQGNNPGCFPRKNDSSIKPKSGLA